MICYIFKVRAASYMSKKEDKQKSGFNIGLLALEGSKFHLETFIDNRLKMQIFKENIDKNFTPGFYDCDIDEFEIYTPNGSQYSKKIISVNKRLKIEDCTKYF